MKKLLLLLLFCPIFVYADMRVVRGANGSHFVQFSRLRDMNPFRGSVTHGAGGTYQASGSYNGTVRGTAGVASSNTVRGRISQTVSRALVRQNVWKFAKIVGGGSLIGVVANAVDAFKIVNELAKEKGYSWDKDEGEWTKEVNDNQIYKIIITNEANSTPEIKTEAEITAWCKEPNSGLYESIGMAKKGGSRSCTHFAYVRGQNNIYDALKAACKSAGGDGTMNEHGVCLKNNVLLGKAVKSFQIRDKVYYNYTDFEEVAESAADKAIEKWVKAANLKESDWSEPEVLVFDGEIAQTPPYTDPNTGKPVQAEYRFSNEKDSSGNTTTKVDEIIKERPDLKRDSPEAPLPESEKGDSDTTRTDTDSNKDKPKEEQSDLCKEHPDIMACQKIGEPQSDFFDDIKIPHITDDRTWKEDSFLPQNGICPAPKTFYIFGKSVELSYVPLCRFLGQVRFIILAAFILMSVYLAIGGLRRD